MAQKHLKELLKEDQEPFYLKDYIEDKKCMILQKQRTRTTQIQVKKPTIFSKKNACFFSIQDSPDLRKSPLFDFSSASPISKKSPNRVLLHVPAKTASLLLEAAMRIKPKPKHKPNSKSSSSSFGLFGSMLKRLTLRNRTQNKLRNVDVQYPKEDIIVEQDEQCVVISNVLVGCETEDHIITTSVSSSSSSSSSSSCYYNGRSSSLDLESSISGRSFDDHHNNDDDEDDGFEFANVLRENNHDFTLNHNNNGDYGALCLSPFRFAKSPARHIFEDNLKYEQDNSVVKCQLLDEDDDEEDKEQNSPVSVLDPPFEDDDYDVHDDDNDSYDQEECSYAFVQRAKQQLLHKLHRFEKLAELDPIELEKRMIEDEEGGVDVDEELVLRQADEIDIYDFESFTFADRGYSHDLLDAVVSTSGFRDIKKPGIKRLISDLIVEEEESVENGMDSTDELLIKRVCKRLESWREVECNTIDMMVGMDLRREIISDWKRPQDAISETATDIEVAIFAVLVKELVADLAY